MKFDANPLVLARVEACNALVYGIGSLFTSICPTLVLQASTLTCTAALKTAVPQSAHMACVSHLSAVRPLCVQRAGRAA